MTKECDEEQARAVRRRERARKAGRWIDRIIRFGQLLKGLFRRR